MPDPSLEALELAIERGHAEAAVTELLAMLHAIDERHVGGST